MRGLGFPHTRGRVVLLVLVVPLVFRAPCVLHCGPGCFVCPWAAARQISGVAMPRQISGRRVACPPARRPRCELRSARRLEARPGPATAHGHRSQFPSVPPAPSTPVGPGVDVWLARCPDVQLWLSISNFARNSSKTHSNIEFASLELQRFWGGSKNNRDKLRARFGWRRCRCRPRAPQPSSLVLPAPHAGSDGGLAALGADGRRVGGVSWF